MSFSNAMTWPRPRQWTRRAVPWVGGLFICAIVAFAGYDIVRGYHAAVESTGRELETQARVIAEQTARSLQAVDVVLRHLAEQFREGTIAKLSPRDLRAYLQEEAVGLVQIDGLLVVRAVRTYARRNSSSSPPTQTWARQKRSSFRGFRSLAPTAT